MVFKFLQMLSGNTFERFAAATNSLREFQERAMPVGDTSLATMTSPGSGVSGHSLLTVGHAERTVGAKHYALMVRAGLPLAKGGPVRFVYTSPSRYKTGKYFVFLENASGSQMQVPGEMERFQDGTSRLYYFNDAAPEVYAGYNKIVVKYIREDGQEAIVLEGSFA